MPQEHRKNYGNLVLPGMRLKNCSRCTKDKPLYQFDNRASTEDGKHHMCKECNRLLSNKTKRRK